MGSYPVAQAKEVQQRLKSTAERTPGFDVRLSHFGLFSLDVLFLAPDLNERLVLLQRTFPEQYAEPAFDWTPHTTMLMDKQEEIHRAIPVLAQDFQPFTARASALSLYRAPDITLLASYQLAGAGAGEKKKQDIYREMKIYRFKVMIFY